MKAKSIMIIFLLPLLVAVALQAEGKTITVDKSGSGDFTSIQDAINNASDGDTIFVKAGTYIENIVIENKSVSLIGEDKENTVIEGKEDGYVLRLYLVDNATISSLTIGNAKGREYSCIFLEDCSNVTLSNNHVTNSPTGDGIMVLRSSFISVEGCVIENNGKIGLHIILSSNNSIIENTIKNNVIGIRLETLSCGNIIRGNTISDNKNTYGLYICGGSNNNIISENIFENNDPNAWDTCTNFWYDPVEKKGNYWDDYQGKDSNHDGVGDTPYQVPGGDNQDMYVLGFFTEEQSPQPKNKAPVANAGGDYYGVVNSSITFDASKSYDPDGEIVEYVWDFGDGETGKGKIVSHSYAVPGNYTVTLTVKDERGATDHDIVTAHVSGYMENRKPVPIIEAEDYAGVGDVIQFDASKSYDPDGEIVNYIWEFGDGKVSYGKLVEHSYSQPGTYEITLKVIDDQGCMNSTTKSIVVSSEESKVEAFFSVETDLLFVGSAITFNASGSIGNIVSYIWEFGDGKNLTTSLPICNHTYLEPGVYQVNLTVVGANGEKDTNSVTIVIEGAWKKATPGFELLLLVLSIILLYVVRRNG